MPTRPTTAAARRQRKLFAPPPKASDFARLCAIAPALRDLERDAVAAGQEHPSGSLAEERQWLAIRRRLDQIVGWSARDSRLSTSEAYETAHRAVRLAFLVGHTEGQPIRQTPPWESEASA